MLMKPTYKQSWNSIQNYGTELKNCNFLDLSVDFFTSYQRQRGNLSLGKKKFNQFYNVL